MPSRNQFSVALPSALRADILKVSDETGESVAYLVRRCVVNAWPAVKAAVTLAGLSPGRHSSSELNTLKTLVNEEASAYGRKASAKDSNDQPARQDRKPRAGRNVPARHGRRD